MKRFVLSRMVFQMNSVLFKFMLRRILLLQRSIFSFNLRCAICAISNFSGFWCQKLTNFHTLNANNFFFRKKYVFIWKVDENTGESTVHCSISTEKGVKWNNSIEFEPICSKLFENRSQKIIRMRIFSYGAKHNIFRFIALIFFFNCLLFSFSFLIFYYLFCSVLIAIYSQPIP